MSTQEHIDHLLKLNRNERVSIAQLLWDSIAVDGDSDPLEVSREEKDLLDERKRKYDAGELKGDSWQNVKSRLLADK